MSAKTTHHIRGSVTYRCQAGASAATAAVAVVVVLAGGLVALAVDRAHPPEPQPGKPVDYVAWANLAFKVPEVDNAAATYERAFELYEGAARDAETALEQDELDAVFMGPWTDKPAAAEWLKLARPALDTFARAARMESCFYRFSASRGEKFSLPRGSIDIASISYLRGQRALTRATLADGWQAWAAGDQHRFVDAIETVLRSGRHAAAQPPLLALLLAASSDRAAYPSVLRAVSEASDPAAAAELLLPVLRGAAAQPISPGRAIAFERVWLYDLAQRIYPAPDANELTVTDPNVVWVLTLPADVNQIMEALQKPTSPVKLGSYRDTRAQIDHAFDLLDRAAAMPYTQARAALAPAIAEYKQAHDEAARAHRVLLDGDPATYLRALTLVARAEAHRRATFVVLHLWQYHAAHGKFPAKLADVPELRKSIVLRTDPFSGLDFVYRPAGDGFTLYSVAQNGKDDRGKHDEKWGDPEGDATEPTATDYVFWPVQ